MMWGWLWWFVALVFVAAIVWIAALPAARRYDRALPPEDPPETIVKRRYARGEIDRDTYQQMIDELRR